MRKLFVISIFLLVSGCEDPEKTKAVLGSISDSSCAMSMHCDQGQYSSTGSSGSYNSPSPMTGSRGGAITIRATSLCPLSSSYGVLDGEMPNGMNKVCFYR